MQKKGAYTSQGIPCSDGDSHARMTVFPASWDPTHVSKKRKTNKTFIETTDSHGDAVGVPMVPFQSDLQQTILRRLNQAVPHNPAPAQGDGRLCLDHILSRVPYKKMLENLFSNLDPAIPDVPILTKAYEESLMRQPMPGERQCVMGELCECMTIDRTNPFVGVEMRLPNDPENTAQMCVLCSRATTQRCFYDICYLSRPIQGVIQRYGSIFGQPGEYAAECMLIAPRAFGLVNMPIPSVSHQRNRYSVTHYGGTKILRQHRVSYEDFHHPSSTGAV